MERTPDVPTEPEQALGPPVIDAQADAIRLANRPNVKDRFDHRRATGTVTFGKGIPHATQSP